MVSTDTSIGFGQLLSHLNFGMMVAGDARYDRFSILTDFMYMNLGGAAARFSAVDFTGFPRIPISAAAHATIAITMDTYSHAIPGLQEDAAQRIDADLRGAIGKS